MIQKYFQLNIHYLWIFYLSIHQLPIDSSLVCVWVWECVQKWALYVVFRVQFCCLILGSLTSTINKATQPTRSAYFTWDWQFFLNKKMAWLHTVVSRLQDHIFVSLTFSWVQIWTQKKRIQLFIFTLPNEKKLIQKMNVIISFFPYEYICMVIIWVYIYNIFTLWCLCTVL